MNRNDKEYLISKIRTQYTEKEHNDLDSLKELDRKVRKPANIFAYTLGTVSALIMGSGMSLVMTDIGEQIGMGDAMIPGIIIGTVGLVTALINYPIYKKLLTSRKKKYSDKILALSDRIMKGE